MYSKGLSPDPLRFWCACAAPSGAMCRLRRDRDSLALPENPLPPCPAARDPRVVLEAPRAPAVCSRRLCELVRAGRWAVARRALANRLGPRSASSLFPCLPWAHPYTDKQNVAHFFTCVLVRRCALPSLSTGCSWRTEEKLEEIATCPTILQGSYPGRKCRGFSPVLP